MSLPSGTRLGPYEIVGKIGAGGMGEVFRAKDTRLGRDVAIKVLPEGFAEDSERLRRFQQEARTLASLSHPNVVQVFEAGEHEGTPYLVMELLEGETLRERLRGKPIPPRRAMEIAREAALGLSAAHSRGILHRDLKPENIFLTKDGRVKVLDFGLAKTHSTASGSKVETRTVSTDLSEPGHVVGTSGYMSPEQVQGDSMDARSDLFSLGVVLWEMVTGARPFQRDSSLETMHAILKDEPPELDPSLKVPPTLERILHTCLAKAPEGRFHSAHDLAFALEGSFATSTASGGGKALPTTHRWLPPLLAGCLGAAFLLLVGALAYARHWPPFAPKPLPTFTPLTLDGEVIQSARFTRRGQSVVYSTQSNDLAARHIRKVDLGSPIVHTLLGPDARLLSVGPGDELAVLTGMNNILRMDAPIGTVGRCPPDGALPQTIAREILDADWGPEGTLALVRRTGSYYGCQLEYPEGRILLTEPKGYLKDLRFSPDGRHLAILRHPEGRDDLGPVTLVDLRTGEARDLTPAWAQVRGLAWRPDGGEIWFSAKEAGAVAWVLYGADLEGHVRRIFTSPGGLCLHDISPDGRVLLSSADEKLRVWANRAGGQVPLELSIGAFSGPGDISADGRWAILADQLGMGPAYALYLRPTDGSVPTLLGKGSWSKFAPDSRRVCVWRRVDARWRPFIVSLDGGEDAWPIGGLDVPSMPVFAWSAAGELLVYARSRSGPSRIWRLTGKEPAALEVPVPEDVQEFAVPGTAGRNLLLKRRGLGWFTLDLGQPSVPARPCPGLLPADEMRGFSADGGWMYVSPDRSSAFKRVHLRTGRRESMPFPAPVGFPVSHFTALSRDGKVFLGLEISIYSRLYLVEGLK